MAWHGYEQRKSKGTRQHHTFPSPRLLVSSRGRMCGEKEGGETYSAPGSVKVDDAETGRAGFGNGFIELYNRGQASGQGRSRD
jgi:hypothetical protein